MATTILAGMFDTCAWCRSAASGRQQPGQIRSARGRVATCRHLSKKRQPPARLPDRLLAHVRRWARNGARFAVDYQGQRVGDIKTGWIAARDAAGLPDAAGFFGASVETIESTYGHHSADHQDSARKAMDSRS
ncbi:hypothetical protein ACFQXB_04945 [Plastorhodobacter daqingensis]|uniref:Integrase n=1 Tax=Plastorhodobacter daqingensis TaxID=1387281 RepID=A0ABW2UJZ7_9RHOB